jgi:hypothetical protein
MLRNVLQNMAYIVSHDMGLAATSFFGFWGCPLTGFMTA